MIVKRACLPIDQAAAATYIRHFRFAFEEATKVAHRLKRRQDVAEYVASWMAGKIVAERQCGSECLVTVELARPVPRKVAERFCRECPRYVPDTFSAAKGTSGATASPH